MRAGRGFSAGGVTVQRVRQPKPPDLTFDAKTLDEMGRIVVDDIVRRIGTQRDPEGRWIKRNAPSTKARKRKQGKPNLSLVDNLKRFATAAGYEVTRNGNRGVTVTPRDRTVSGYLVKMGYHWVGLSKQGRALVLALVKQWRMNRIKRVRR